MINMMLDKELFGTCLRYKLLESDKTFSIAACDTLYDAIENYSDVTLSFDDIEEKFNIYTLAEFEDYLLNNTGMDEQSIEEFYHSDNTILDYIIGNGWLGDEFEENNQKYVIVNLDIKK